MFLKTKIKYEQPSNTYLLKSKKVVRIGQKLQKSGKEQ